jgi:hypothetical protein
LVDAQRIIGSFARINNLSARVSELERMYAEKEAECEALKIQDQSKCKGTGKCCTIGDAVINAFDRNELVCGPEDMPSF